MDRETVDGIIRMLMAIHANPELLLEHFGLRETTRRKRMAPEFRRRARQRLAESDRNVAEAREIFARREQRLREWDEYMARRRARLRRLTFGVLGR